MKNQYIGEDCLKRGGGQFAHLRGGGGGGGGGGGSRKTNRGIA